MWRKATFVHRVDSLELVAQMLMVIIARELMARDLDDPLLLGRKLSMGAQSRDDAQDQHDISEQRTRPLLHCTDQGALSHMASAT